MDSSETHVVLVVPPVIQLSIPLLGPSYLAAGLRRRGLGATIFYPGFEYSARVGHDLYWAVASIPLTLIGEAIFRDAAFPERATAPGQQPLAVQMLHTDAFVPRSPWIPRAEVTDEDVKRLIAEVPDFIKYAAERIVSVKPRIVGFSSSYQQSMASIAIAREIKRLNPEIITVIGGSNVHEPMGSAMLSTTAAIDYAFSGESDDAFPQFCKDYVDSGRLPEDRVIKCEMIKQMDSLPLPDYDDYFVAAQHVRNREQIPLPLPYSLGLETSRGCWWGEKHWCTFCGLNATEMNYRRKSKERIVSEVKHLTSKYETPRFDVTDRIMPSNFTKTVLPELAKMDHGMLFAYQVKANLDEDDLDAFAAAGVLEIEPGIESLSQHCLELMDKGMTPAQAIRLLRETKVRGIFVVWNHLVGFPGETKADYEAVIELAPLLEHLQAPVRWGPLLLERFNYYHSHPEKWGLGPMRAWPVYAELYGPGSHVDNVSFYHQVEYETDLSADADLRARFHKAFMAWNQQWYGVVKVPPVLAVRQRADGAHVVFDTRRVAAAPETVLTQAQVAALDFVCKPTSDERVPTEHRAAVDELIAMKFVARYSGDVVSLVTRGDFSIHPRLLREIGVPLTPEAREIIGYHAPELVPRVVGL